MKKDAAKATPSSALLILAKNLATLRDATPKLNSQSAIAKKAGINQRTVGRILNLEHEPTVAQIAKLATVFKLKPWMLLVPDLSPSNTPMLAADSGNVKQLLEYIASTKEALEGYLQEDGNTQTGAASSETQVR